jgi:hypothetical protein
MPTTRLISTLTALTVLTGVTVLLPTAASAQSAGADARGEAALRASTATAQDAQARIQAVLDAAVEAGIPVRLLENKVTEGRAKGVAEGRIALALETRFASLTGARETLAEGGIATVTEGELSVAADAVDAGVSPEALVDVFGASEGERRAVATAVLASLVQLGVGSTEAVARVQGALAAGAGALANLHAEVAAQLRAGGLVPPVDLSAAGALGGVLRPGGG